MSIVHGAHLSTEEQRKIVSVNSLEEIISHFELADENTLIIFDIDSTLTTPSDQILQRQTIQRYKDFYDSNFNALTENEKRIFLHLIVVASPSILVEQEFPTVIKELQKKMVKTIAYTASKTGALGKMKSFPQWRFNELQRLGIDFSAIYPGKILFKELADLDGDFPGMEKGIVYSGYANSKGDVLPFVLKELNLPINRIIVIDDKENNIQSLLKAANNNYSTTRLLGLHYRGINNIVKENISFDVFKQRILKIILRSTN